MVSHIVMRLMSIRGLRVSEKIAKCFWRLCVIYWLLFAHLSLKFYMKRLQLAFFR